MAAEDLQRQTVLASTASSPGAYVERPYTESPDSWNGLTSPAAPSLASRPCISPTTSHGNDVTSLQGPVHRSWEPPPRAKPGRKPMNDNPIDKRKTQNRASQRAFRERKAEQIRRAESDTQELKRSNQELELKCRNYEESFRALQRGSLDFEKQLAEKQQVIDLLRLELSNITQRLKGGLIEPDFSAPHTVEARVGSASRRRANESSISSDPSPVSPPASLSVSRGCGRCDNTVDCPCVDDYVEADLPEPKQTLLSVPSPAHHPIPVDFTFSRLTSQSHPVPGSCSRCQQDPRQRLWCMTLARESTQKQLHSGGEAASSAGTAANIRDSLVQSQPAQGRAVYINCSQTYPLLKDSNDSEKLLDSSWMRTVLTRTPQESDGHHSPMEVELASALTALSRHGQRDTGS